MSIEKHSTIWKPLLNCVVKNSVEVLCNFKVDSGILYFNMYDSHSQIHQLTHVQTCCFKTELTENWLYMSLHLDKNNTASWIVWYNSWPNIKSRLISWVIWNSEMLPNYYVECIRFRVFSCLLFLADRIKFAFSQRSWDAAHSSGTYLILQAVFKITKSLMCLQTMKLKYFQKTWSF